MHQRSESGNAFCNAGLTQDYTEAVLCLLPFEKRIDWEHFCCLRLIASRSLISTAAVTDFRSCSHLQVGKSQLLDGNSEHDESVLATSAPSNT